MQKKHTSTCPQIPKDQEQKHLEKEGPWGNIKGKDLIGI